MTAHTLTPSAVRRRERLLATVRRVGGEWSTARAMELYRRLGLAPCRSTARGDLKTLADRGLLIQHDHHGRRYFTVNNAIGGSR